MSDTPLEQPQSLDFGAGLTDEEIFESRAYRERAHLDGFLESAGPSDRDLMSRADVAAIPLSEIWQLYSARAYEFIISHEVSSRAIYEKKYRRAIWPGKDSGVTIGVGYDLGYNDSEDFGSDWKPLLPPEVFQRLAGAVRKRRGDARALVGQLQDIEIDWATAETVFKTVTVPKFCRLVLAVFPNARALAPDAFGSILSLVYNRGAKLQGPTRREMLAIRDAMAARKFDAIPELIRQMRRLWPDLRGLRDRRTAEAKLFEDGLIQMQRVFNTPQVASGPVSNGPIASQMETLRPGADDDGVGGDLAGQPEDVTEDMEAALPELPAGDLEATAPGYSAVTWVANDDHSTEYRHIRAVDRQLSGCSFSFSGRDLELLIRTNSFEPERSGKRIVFGLRGAVLDADVSSPGDADMQIDRASLRLKDTRPNHRTFNCVIGVYNLETGKLSGFKASTVPNRGAIWAHTHAPHPGCNLLPAGCYKYYVGTHNKKTPGCLREAEPFTVLRTRINLAYDARDNWDACTPWDNIHPGFVDRRGSAEFSSQGCQVVRGSYNPSTGKYSREWAHFRAALGLSPNGRGNDGMKFSYVLLTGLEGAIAARLRDQGSDTDLNAVFPSLVRLRQGSRGDSVKRLQMALGREANGVFDGGLKKALADHQKSKGLPWDGVYAPDHDALLGLAVLGSGPIVVASALRTAQLAESMGGLLPAPVRRILSLYMRRLAGARKSQQPTQVSRRWRTYHIMRA